MKRWTLLGAAILGVSLALADHPKPAGKPAFLIPGLGDVRHPVSTSSKEAQQFFDQGLALIFAFNHDEAERAFRRAAELDPKLAMAWWGVALSVGPNYNLDADEAKLKVAYEAMQMALKLAANVPEQEKAYVEALAKRYSADPKADKKKLAVEYSQAMRAVAKKYPDDLDAAVLAAESLMNLRPWELWNADGTLAEGTPEILAILEAVLKRNPDHTGANHYYIHAVEASPSPERGLPSAVRLRTLAPAAGHLVHMPSHIYIRSGDYDAAARANEQAIAADQAYFKLGGKADGVYAMMYYSHNIHFLAVAEATQGRPKEALKAADQLVAHVGPMIAHMPMLEGFLPTPILIQVRCGRWDELLQRPRPDAKQKIVTALWHFGRGRALAAQGKADEAAKELTALHAVRKTIPDDQVYLERNKVQEVLAVAEPLLEGKIAVARKEYKAAAGFFQQAVAAEDKLKYMEPADWYIPARESLGAAFLLAGEPAEAEKVFRADLEIHRRSGRSLFGLREALKAQKKDYAAGLVDQEFQRAWKNAEGVPLRIEDL